MKRLVVLIFCIIATLNVAADEVDKLKEWFNNGDYEAVMSHVDHLHNISPIKYNDEFVKIWKEKCNKAIKDKEKKEQAEAEAIALQNAKMKAKQDSIDAAVEIAQYENNTQKLKTLQATAEAKEKEAEAKIKEEENKKKEREDKERREKEKVRKENKLTYIYVKEDFWGLLRGVKASLTDCKICNDEEEAFRSVCITLYKKEKFQEYEELNYLYITAEVEIKDAINDTSLCTGNFEVKYPEDLIKDEKEAYKRLSEEIAGYINEKLAKE